MSRHRPANNFQGDLHTQTHGTAWMARMQQRLRHSNGKGWRVWGLLIPVFAMNARCQAADREVVQNLRLTAFCSAKPARVVLHLPSQ
jgi:hypothetical protein